jgi:hypothetical protein
MCLALFKCVGSSTFWVSDCNYGLGRRRVGASGVSVRARDLEGLRDTDERNDVGIFEVPTVLVVNKPEFHPNNISGQV